MEDDLMCQLMTILGTGPEEAKRFLELANYDLQTAITLYFSAQGEPLQASRHEASNIEDWRADPEDVRAPLPSKTDRLYSDHMLMEHIRRHTGPPGGVVAEAGLSAFRADTSTQNGLAGTSRQAGSNAGGLADLFEAPTVLLFKGTFEEAFQEALKDNGRWMLVNVQSNSEFASHRLNRDTWADPALASIVGGSFVFCQMEASSEVGRKTVAAYGLNNLPITFVVDPNTRAKLREWHGFIEPHRLCEDLVPFMDVNIYSKEAARLGTSNMRRQASRAASAIAASKVPLTEEDELQMALAASMQDNSGSPKPRRADSIHSSEGVIESSEDDDDDDDESVEMVLNEPMPLPSKDPEQLAQEALASLPPEPAAGTPGACRMAVRLPDGTRPARRFLQTEPVRTLHTWCLALCPEAAAGRPFSLSLGQALGGPAGEPLAMDQTLAESKAANSLLIFKWE